jgi:hypothetical protein
MADLLVLTCSDQLLIKQKYIYIFSKIAALNEEVSCSESLAEGVLDFLKKNVE